MKGNGGRNIGAAPGDIERAHPAETIAGDDNPILFDLVKGTRRLDR